MNTKDALPSASSVSHHSRTQSQNDNIRVDSRSADSISAGKVLGDIEAEQQIVAAGEKKYHRLGWRQLTLMLVVEAIALGALSIPSTFATLGMIAGVICCIGIGLIAIYTSYVIGQVKLAFPFVHHYGDAGTLLMGRFGYELFSGMFPASAYFSLFTSGFSFYIPPIMLFVLIKKGNWYSRANNLLALVNGCVFVFGLAVLVCGLYSSIDDIVMWLVYCSL